MSIIPESVDAIDESTVIGDHLVLTYLQDAASVIRIYDLSGRFQRQVSLPGIGSVSEIKGKPNDPEAFFAFSSFTQPTQIYRTDVTSGETTLFREVKFDFDPRRYTVEQVFYESEDGTRVPMFVSHRADLEQVGRAVAGGGLGVQDDQRAIHRRESTGAVRAGEASRAARR